MPPPPEAAGRGRRASNLYPEPLEAGIRLAGDLNELVVALDRIFSRMASARVVRSVHGFSSGAAEG